MSNSNNGFTDVEQEQLQKLRASYPTFYIWQATSTYLDKNKYLPVTAKFQSLLKHNGLTQYAELQAGDEEPFVIVVSGKEIQVTYGVQNSSDRNVHKLKAFGPLIEALEIKKDNQIFISVHNSKVHMWNLSLQVYIKPDTLRDAPDPVTLGERSQLRERQVIFRTIPALLGESIFKIPAFQRPYSWREIEIEEFLEDIEDVADEFSSTQTATEEDGFFLGTIITKSTHGIDKSKVKDIIDGQQRFITAYLVLLGIAEILIKAGECAAAEEVLRYLLRQGLHETDRYRLSPTIIPCNRDRRSFYELIRKVLEQFPENKELNDTLGLVTNTTTSSNLGKQWGYIQSYLADKFTINPEIQYYCKIKHVQKLREFYQAIVYRAEVLNHELDTKEDPSLIFERLNTRGKELGLSDIVRNAFFACNYYDDSNTAPDPVKLERFNERSFVGFEEQFAQVPIDERHRNQTALKNINLFYSHYALILSKGKATKKTAFSFIQSHFNNYNDYKKLFFQIEDEANYHLLLMNNLDPLDSFKKLNQSKSHVKNLARLDVPNAIRPLIILLFKAREIGDITKKDFDWYSSQLESFIVRRWLAGFTPAGLFTVFKQFLSSQWREPNAWDDREKFIKTINKRDIKLHQITNKSLSEQFEPAGFEVPRSNHPIVRYVLRRIEDNNRKNTRLMDDHDATVEHLLPSKPKKGTWENEKEWKQNDTYPDFKSLHSHYKNRLGNLTLLEGGINSQVSNGPWEAKREHIHKTTSWKMTTDITGSKKMWTPDRIDKREKELIKAILNIWKPLDEPEDGFA